MPTITTASQKVTEFPNRFISPFGNDPIVPLYSSVPMFNPQTDCLPCVICGNVATRTLIIQQQATRFADYVPTFANSVQVNTGANTV
jgi:hypothetical protein